MKEKDITPKIIGLSKKIAEHWRMEIYEGCWLHLEHLRFTKEEKLFLVTCVNGEDIEVGGFHWTSRREFINGEDFPIPLISDCLEKLRKLGWHKSYMQIAPFINIFLMGHKTLKELHEALLSALLGVSKEAK